jgi:hypothetical protein
MKTDGSRRLMTMGCSFDRREVRVDPGSSRPYDAAEWDDALVIVTAGVLELEALSGRRWRFPRGAILWLTELPVRALHSCGEESLVLTAVSRESMNSPTPDRPI